MTHADAVQNGISALDQNAPKGWRKRVNLENLDVASTESCVLGQIYGDYYDGMNALIGANRTMKESIQFSEENGFEAPLIDDHLDETERDYNGLEAAWREALA